MASLLDDLLKPISDTSFCGEDGSYDPDFEAARMEADKSTENNYAVMEEASKRFLTKKSKDMRALGYLTLGSAMNDGLDAFAEAIVGYCKLVMDHWEDIHPKRPAARSNALKWLNGERIVALLGGLDGGATYETLLSAHDHLTELRSFCDRKFPDSPPSFGGFAKVVKDHTERNKPRPVEEKQEEAAVAAPSGPAGIASVDDGFLAIQNGAFYLMENDRTNALAYRLLRMLKWEPLRDAPPNTGGKTLVPAPYPATMDAYRNMFQSAAWPDLAKNGEEAFSGDGMPFWFDLQRFICSALMGMGPEYAACAKAVRVELALLLSRIPTLANLCYDDGTPFADSMTREWIQADVLSTLGGSGGGPAPIKKKGDVGEEQKQANLLLGEGKLETALQILRTGLANDSSEKNNFDRKLIMAELLFKGNKPHVARSLLEDLKLSIERYSLVQWDPELVISVYHLSQKVYLTLMASADDGLKPMLYQKALEMHTQISKLDPVLALSAEI
ncbi:MAG TPA: type VI secretion system protein TssA [Fibrobacteria bacterium]|nr:type VI secretion system protein TssA [Fibrobacteria bacterium]